jgi:hypothetical protein
MRFLCGSAVIAASIAFAAPGWALDRAACSQAYASGLKLRNDGKLAEAFASYQSCADPSCPKAIRADCKVRADGIEKLLPSIVVTAKDEKGADLVDAKLEIDGKLVSDMLSARAIPMDTGTHVVRISPSGGEPMEQKILVVAGEKNRSVAFSIKARTEAPVPTPTPTPSEPIVPPTPPPTPKDTTPEPTAPAARNHSAVPWIVTGVGFGGAIAGVAFLKRSSDIQSQVDKLCHAIILAPGVPCEQDSRASDAKTAGIVSLIGGGVLLAGGLAWYALEKVDKPPRPPTSAPWILIGAGVGAILAGGVMTIIGATASSTDTATDFTPAGLGVGAAGVSMVATGLVWRATEAKLP